MDLNEVNDNCSGLLVICTFKEKSSSSACVVVVHKKLPHLNSTSGILMLNIEVYLLSKSNGSMASECLVNISSTEYHVAVFSYINGTVVGKQHKG